MTQSNPFLEIHMLTCLPRQEVLVDTLSRMIDDTDVEGTKIIATFDHTVTEAEDPRVRQTEASKAILKKFLDGGDAQYLLFCEDDIVFNDFFIDNLLHWSVIVDGRLRFGSLYNPNVDMIEAVDDCTAIAIPEKVYGSQAFIMTRSMAETIYDDWDSMTGTEMQDIRMSRIAAKHGADIYYHMPSLVDHRPVESTWGGVDHKAVDFIKDWRHDNA